MHASRDYCLVFSGRTFNITGTPVVTGYQLYILTDSLGTAPAEAGGTMSLPGVSNLPGPVVVGTATGPNSDLVKRRKVFIVGSTVLCSAETLFLFCIQRPLAMFVFGS
jgi:hypothetical protein